MANKILVVDDNASNRLLLRDILAYYGYEVIEAVNGREGIETALEQKPAIVLMDIQMPVMNGFEAARLLRSNPRTKEIKLIAQTSFAMKGDRGRIFEAGFDAYVSKPINSAELLGLIEDMLEGSKDE